MHLVPPPDSSKCGAKRRNRKDHCKNPAGFKTDHVGTGRCYLHGGATPVKHGLRSTVTGSRLKERIAAHLANPDPFNLLPELAQLRGLAEDLMERWDSIYGEDGALLAWHESFKNPDAPAYAQKPRTMLDFSSVAAVVDKVGVMVDRIHKQRAEKLVTYEFLNKVIDLFAAEWVGSMKEAGISPDAISVTIDRTGERWRGVDLAAVKLLD